MPAVARKSGTDSVLSKTGTGKRCPKPVDTKTDEGSSDVFSNGIGVVKQGDKVAPHKKSGCDPDESVMTIQSPTVYANGKQLARIGDKYTPDNIITSGSPNVFAG